MNLEERGSLCEIERRRPVGPPLRPRHAILRRSVPNRGIVPARWRP